ncbi:hypothetical protein PR202_ga28308 [Eleusine coracana subsp. coracana]|uniref:LOB domain-containing protein n=1 Tax=Eleusine coracana subsp. coracana TaxID=191504 RepID=A0AAV5DJ32_ELECO|nr:hypothetical protein PR202_ga28308 [Eleusine coracana subsp. coracana]
MCGPGYRRRAHRWSLGCRAEGLALLAIGDGRLGLVVTEAFTGGPMKFRKQEASEAMSDTKGKGVMQWSGEACAACQHLQHACGPECVFAPHFPASEGTARFAKVDARFGADHLGLVLCSLSREQQAEAVCEFVFEAQQW